MKNSKIFYFLRILLFIKLISSNIGESAEGGSLEIKQPFKTRTREIVCAHAKFSIEKCALNYFYGQLKDPLENFFLFIDEATKYVLKEYEECEKREKIETMENKSLLRNYVENYLLLNKEEYTKEEVEFIFMNILCELNKKAMKKESGSSLKERYMKNILLEMHYNRMLYNGFWKKIMDETKKELMDKIILGNFTPKEKEFLLVKIYKTMLNKYIIMRLNTLRSFNKLIEERARLYKFKIVGDYDISKIKKEENIIKFEIEQYIYRIMNDTKNRGIKKECKGERLYSKLESCNILVPKLTSEKVSTLEKTSKLEAASSLETLSTSYLESVLEMLLLYNSSSEAVSFLVSSLESLELVKDSTKLESESVSVIDNKKRSDYMEDLSSGLEKLSFEILNVEAPHTSILESENDSKLESIEFLDEKSVRTPFEFLNETENLDLLSFKTLSEVSSTPILKSKDDSKLESIEVLEKESEQ
ncbi:hypothetical protein PRELSG_0030800 [Plasmodium relictum]|uniref:Uncharacterized protein n=1 Tax=Plasmodium relictum TaxID=85471 RepID=A0A1J1GKB3_PLARL|nr:hypothetical protein PRELSG_0030800 [Plasmodium relictum]CRG84972.1 hypothetical protein PRELSG_0030800 [Plasmodium relictum]